MRRTCRHGRDRRLRFEFATSKYFCGTEVLTVMESLEQCVFLLQRRAKALKTLRQFVSIGCALFVLTLLVMEVSREITSADRVIEWAGLPSAVIDQLLDAASGPDMHGVVVDANLAQSVTEARWQSNHVDSISIAFVILPIIIGAVVSMANISATPVCVGVVLSVLLKFVPQVLEFAHHEAGAKSMSVVAVGERSDIDSTISYWAQLDDERLHTEWRALSRAEAMSAIHGMTEDSTFGLMLRLVDILEDSSSKAWSKSLLALKQGDILRAREYYSAIKAFPAGVAPNERWALETRLGVGDLLPEASNYSAYWYASQLVVECSVVASGICLLLLGVISLLLRTLETNCNCVSAWLERTERPDRRVYS